MKVSPSGNTHVAITFVLLSSLVLTGCTSSASPETASDVPTPEPTPTTTGRSWQGTTVSSSLIEYRTPRDTVDSITVHLTLDNGTITDYTIDYVAAEPMSEKFQKWFREAIGQQLIGKPLAGLKVGVVNGASLTSAAFNKALVELQKL